MIGVKMKIIREISMDETLRIFNSIINRIPGWKVDDKQYQRNKKKNEEVFLF